MKVEKVTAQAVLQLIKEFDGDTPMIIAMEELAELQQAISKGLRGKLDKDNMTEEIADVLICISWVMAKFEIDTNELAKWQNIKNERCHNRLTTGTFK